MLKIKKIGIELELSSLTHRMYPSGKWENISISGHRKVPVYKKYLPINCIFGITYEYYDNQIEFNFNWESMRASHFFKFLDYLHDDNFFITFKEPAFVGTHIHLIIEKNSVIIDYRLRWKKMALFNNLLIYYQKIFKHLLNTNNKIINNTATLELKRLLSNHNILIYFDYEFFQGELSKIRSSFGIENYYYMNGKKKAKYQPILRSEKNKGKPFTLEVRYIPNMVMINKTLYKDLMKIISSSLNQKGSKFINIKKNILINYKKLCSIYYDYKQNDNLFELLPIAETRDLLSNYL